MINIRRISHSKDPLWTMGIASSVKHMRLTINEVVWQRGFVRFAVGFTVAWVVWITKTVCKRFPRGAAATPGKDLYSCHGNKQKQFLLRDHSKQRKWCGSGAGHHDKVMLQGPASRWQFKCNLSAALDCEGRTVKNYLYQSNLQLSTNSKAPWAQSPST